MQKYSKNGELKGFFCENLLLRVVKASCDLGCLDRRLQALGNKNELKPL
jgi:hypothetical protein